MKNSNKRLTELLKQVEVEKPHSDFTNDIMNMITDDAMEMELNPVLKSVQTIEKAPMHMTDLVVEKIMADSNKSYSLINPSELKRAALIMTIGLLISIVLWINSDITFNFQQDSSIDEIIFNVFTILISATTLWALDRRMRKRYQPTEGR